MHDLAPNQIDFIEQRFPAEAAGAFAQAQAKALALGQSVLLSKGDAIYRLSPDGSVVFVKKIEPPVQVDRGSKIVLW